MHSPSQWPNATEEFPQRGSYASKPASDALPTSAHTVFCKTRTGAVFWTNSGPASEHVFGHRPCPSLSTVSPRLFVGLWPRREEVATLVAQQQRWQWPKGSSIVEQHRLHLTLHFLGNIDYVRLAEITAGIRVPFEPFDLSFTHAEVWPQGIAVIGATPVPEPLRTLHSRLAEALRKLSLPLEMRPFRPHVTLARRAEGASPPREPFRLSWRVDSYVLVESVLGPDGGYHVRQRYTEEASAQPADTS